MTNEMIKTEYSNIIDWQCQQQLKSIKEIYGKKLSNEEFGVLVNLGRTTGLNPFLREIWAIKYGDSAAQIFVGRDGYRKSAQANKNYDYHLTDAVYSKDKFLVRDGQVSHEYHIADRGNLIGAYCIVKRKSSTQPIFVFVELKEYDTNQSLWKTKKATMIKKVAEAQALRMAFQELFAGTYSEDEYEPEDVTPRGKSEKAQSKLSTVIEGKSVKIGNLDALLLSIENAKSWDDLDSIAEQAKDLNEIEKSKLRQAYRLKKQSIPSGLSEDTDVFTTTDAELTDFDKIKNQLLNAKSRDTLDVAADLITTVNQNLQTELLSIYEERKTQLN
jgi:phage recombination protein Bet